MPMPLETNNGSEKPQGLSDKNEFQPKPIEQPILDPAAKAQIMPEAETNSRPSSGGLHGFYRANRMYVWAIAIGLVVIAVLAFFAFRKKGPAPAKEANVALSVSINGG